MHPQNVLCETEKLGVGKGGGVLLGARRRSGSKVYGRYGSGNNDLKVYGSGATMTWSPKLKVLANDR